LNLAKRNTNKDINFDNKSILVLDQNNNIAGIGDLDISFAIKPKVVFNAIG
jgi:tRNA pseudouridine55 synthase